VIRISAIAALVYPLLRFEAIEASAEAFSIKARPPLATYSAN
jgi:hypothetical protein